MIVYCIFCKYVIVMCTCIGHIHLRYLLLCAFLIFFTPQCPNVSYFYGPIVPEINNSILFYILLNPKVSQGKSRDTCGTQRKQAIQGAN